MGINCSFILCSCLSRGGEATEEHEGAPRDARRRREEREGKTFHNGVQLPHTVCRFDVNGPGAGASTAREKNRSALPSRYVNFMILLRDPSSRCVSLLLQASTSRPACHLVLLSSIMASQCSIFAALFERDFSSQSESTMEVKLVQRTRVFGVTLIHLNLSSFNLRKNARFPAQA